MPIFVCYRGDCDHLALQRVTDLSAFVAPDALGQQWLCVQTALEEIPRDALAAGIAELLPVQALAHKLGLSREGTQWKMLDCPDEAAMRRELARPSYPPAADSQAKLEQTGGRLEAAPTPEQETPMSATTPELEPAQSLEWLSRRVESLERSLHSLFEAVRSQPWVMTHPNWPHEVLLRQGDMLHLYHSELVRWHRVAGGGRGETPLPDLQHLVLRPHPWRRQPYVKGRNMTVGQLVATADAEGWNDDEAAENLELPAEAVREARAFAQANRWLLSFEAAYERLLLDRKGLARGTVLVP